MKRPLQVGDVVSDSTVLSVAGDLTSYMAGWVKFKHMRDGVITFERMKSNSLRWLVVEISNPKGTQK